MTPRWTGFKSPLAHGIRQYVAFKRALGRSFATEERALRLLDHFLVEHRVQTIEEISPEILATFMASRPRTEPKSYNGLLGIVRRLLDWLVTHRLLSKSPLRVHPRRETAHRLPFLFDLPTARRLLEAASRIPEGPRAPLRASTYHAVFAILYGLGLRVAEVAHLCCGDVDLDRNVLTVRRGKFGKSRLVPFGPRMAELLRRYRGERQARGMSCGSDAPWFSFNGARPISTNSIRNLFRDRLVPELNLTIPAGTSRPTVHCLRHSFAAGTLLRWYRAGEDPAARLQHLSTFLGHVNTNATAVYLTITAELLREANDRFEAFASPPVGKEAAP
jgi:site-specific recombinase XerD